ncbi:helix-turn-helix domain-containing protein [Roseateles asaccharophilus]|uniref:Cytoskeleton protein RodZ n=1 Tax=Roseateles asaccharophilus TaxID=582607 RepID=A0ABU2A2Q4_9BURK|nr:helix-turn-helix domain-containing protein [Roseateles asaccharophilus]MDR7331474.1 cytoskeleton protein RodZ [Roseateles asaccharophilus]
MTEGSVSQPATAGAWLKSVRQQRGLHIAALAVTLKVPQAKLEALEADRYNELPDATFARALATAMCRALKVDAAPVLALLPRTLANDFDVRPGLNQPFRERGSGSIDGGALALLGRPVVWGPALLLLAAAAVYWMPASWFERTETQATPVAVFPPAASTVAAASAPVVEFVPAPAAQPASEPAASTPVAASAAAPAPAPQTIAAAPVPVTTVPAAVAPTPTVPAGQALRVTATAETWVEVVDAQGQTLLSRLLREGEQQLLGGSAPYKVRVGNVAGTRIEWRGAAVDLAGRSKDNVARLELN